MLSPKRTRYRKPHRGGSRASQGVATKGNTLIFGEFGLQALAPAWITARQIEAGRRVITRAAKRGGKVYIRIFPQKAICARPAETRMGSGKGSPEYWVAVVKPGRILYEIQGIAAPLAESALTLASAKMPLRTKIISNLK
jgi:large subunit ribosomal protein L16